jgi:hypothetical protein
MTLTYQDDFANAEEQTLDDFFCLLSNVNDVTYSPLAQATSGGTVAGSGELTIKISSSDICYQTFFNTALTNFNVGSSITFNLYYTSSPMLGTFNGRITAGLINMSNATGGTIGGTTATGSIQ